MTEQSNNSSFTSIMLSDPRELPVIVWKSGHRHSHGSEMSIIQVRDLHLLVCGQCAAHVLHLREYGGEFACEERNEHVLECVR